MENLKYEAITNRTQYNKYCKILEELVESNPKSKAVRDQIDLLTTLIEKWDEEYSSFGEQSI